MFYSFLCLLSLWLNRKFSMFSCCFGGSVIHNVPRFATQQTTIKETFLLCFACSSLLCSWDCSAVLRSGVCWELSLNYSKFNLKLLVSSFWQVVDFWFRVLVFFRVVVKGRCSYHAFGYNVSNTIYYFVRFVAHQEIIDFLLRKVSGWLSLS